MDHCKNIQFAQEALVLETAAGIRNPFKIAEIVEAGQKTGQLANNLGYSGSELGALKRSGDLAPLLGIFKGQGPLNNKGHRAVVNEMDFHLCSEDSCLNSKPALFHLFDEGVVERACDFRLGGVDE
jgi:hypothetical protein